MCKITDNIQESRQKSDLEIYQNRRMYDILNMKLVPNDGILRGIHHEINGQPRLMPLHPTDSLRYIFALNIGKVRVKKIFDDETLEVDDETTAKIQNIWYEFNNIIKNIDGQRMYMSNTEIRLMTVGEYIIKKGMNLVMNHLHEGDELIQHTRNML